MSVDASGIERESSHVFSSTLLYTEASTSIVCEEDGAILQESYSNTYIVLEAGRLILRLFVHLFSFIFFIPILLRNVIIFLLILLQDTGIVETKYPKV